MPKSKILATFSVISILIILTLVFISPKAVETSIKSDFCLVRTYGLYKKVFMSKDGRIIDAEKKNITTSEGQAYMLLRSIIIGDRKTFDLIYKWAKYNLQRKDSLFAWLWGENPTGHYKILDNNSATDADVDIAFALLLAFEKWGKFEYLEEARPIINSIWDKETRRVSKHLILMPGVMQNTSKKVEVNVSYFSPYAFRYFQKYDENHDWNQVIDSSYYYLKEASDKTQTKLPPDWFLIENGQIVLEDSTRSDFSYDAIRVFTRIYLDYAATGEKRALPILEKSKFFIDKWKDDKTMYVHYQANGLLRDNNKFVGSIGMLVPIMGIFDKKTAAEIYTKEIEPYYRNKRNWLVREDYYGKNLLWFGCFFSNKDSEQYRYMYKRRLIDY
jgi:endo-1,4-beta-D-glucanase Y